jgi:predicted amidohydrolase
MAVAQMPRFSRVEEGVAWLLERVPRVDLLVLPEYWRGARALEEGEFGRVVSALGEVAGVVGGVVVGGGLAVRRGGAVVNVCPVVGRDGLLTWGEKIFPSAATGERGWVSPGRRLALFRAGGFVVGCLVCVDLLYPELARRLASAGAEVLVNPASISADRRGLWRAVGLVRAFENSVYVAAALGTGYRYADGRPAAGGSYVASPNGGLVEFGEEAGVYTARISRSELDYARSRRRYLEDVARGAPEVDLNTHGL